MANKEAVKESNKIFFENNRKRHALKEVNEQIDKLEIQLYDLKTIRDVLRDSICHTCINLKNGECEYERCCGSLENYFKDKRIIKNDK